MKALTVAAAAAVCLLFAPAAARAHVTPVPSPSAAALSAPSDATVTGWARQWLRYMEIGHIDDRSQLSPELDAAMTDDVVHSVQAQMNSLGEPIAVELARKASANGYVGYYFRLRFDNGYWTERLVLDTNDKIALLRFYPGSP
ncbi:MAG: hypothetical protein ACREMP_11585 [Candidatus Tyrphobacter sp.]